MIEHLTVNWICTKNNTLADLPLRRGELHMRNLRSFPLSCFLIAIAFLALPGCKIEIRVPQGGTVVSSDGAYTCMAGQTCVIDVVDFFFDQTFIAQPAHGYYFSRWEEREQYLCGGVTTPCTLSTAGFEGNPVLLSMLESDGTFFLKPRFIATLVCPEPAIVISPQPPATD